MKSWSTGAIRQLYRLELYELVGLMASAVAVLVFFVFSHRLGQTIGIHGSHWIVVNNVLGMYRNSLAWVFTGVLALLGTLVGFFRRSNHRVLRSVTYLLRILIAFCMMLVIYEVVNFYITAFHLPDRDITLGVIDRALFFGKLPSEWMQPIISRPLTYILSGAYMSWFTLTYVTILLMMSHSRRAAVEYVATALITFYIGYLTYALVPATGPVYTVTYAHAIGGITASFTADKSLVAHDCFPSLHTGITIVMLTFVWRYRRKWMWLYAPLCTLIVWSTLYLRFHYAIDDVAGLSLAVVMTIVVPMMVAAWQHRRDKVTSLAIHRIPKTQVAREAMSELA